MTRSPAWSLVALAVLAALVAGCGDNARDAVVQPLLAPCYVPFPRLCLQVGAPGEPPLPHAHISGFTFRWGVESTIRYHQEDVWFPREDAINEYTLDALLGETALPAGTRFSQAFLDEAPDEWFVRRDANLVDWRGTAVACDADVCRVLLEAGPTAYRVDFELTGDDDISLRALAVVDRP